MNMDLKMKDRIVKLVLIGSGTSGRGKGGWTGKGG
jgi:hypothetical protein